MDSENNAKTKSGNPAKKCKYTLWHHHQRFNSTGPFLGFEEEEESNAPTPSRIFSVLDLDSRFFPEGLQPGYIVEVKGPENCGKTFLLTYFIAQLLTRSPTQKAVLIDTSHQFSLRNLVCMVSFLSCGKVFNKPGDKYLTATEIIEATPELATYLDRLIVIKCYSVEQFMLTVGFEDNSTLRKLIKRDLEIALVAIDTIDCYSFTDSMDRNQPLDMLAELRKNCERVPVICSTIRIPSSFQLVDKSAPTPQKDAETPWFSNITIDPTIFTHTLSIVPGAPKKKASEMQFAKAYLRSKQRANMVGSAEIQRVKFSIFSDMLWVAP